MTYALYFLVCYVFIVICAKYNIEPPNDIAMVIIAILTAGEVISWRCKK